MAWIEPLVTALAIHGAVHGAAPRVRIALAVDPRLPAAVSRYAVAETAAIWRPYGVEISTVDATTSCEAIDAIDTVLTVRLTGQRVPGGALSSPFASMRFLPNGRPDPTILVHEQAITTLALGSVVVNGAREGQWPGTLRNQIYGRIVGRVVAHEIGHWLISRDHSPGGLMRAALSSQELAAPERGRFTLAAGDVARLEAALAGQLVAQGFSPAPSASAQD